MAIFYDPLACGSGELCAPDLLFKHTPALLQGHRITAVLPQLLHDSLLKALVRCHCHIVSPFGFDPNHTVQISNPLREWSTYILADYVLSLVKVALHIKYIIVSASFRILESIDES